MKSYEKPLAFLRENNTSACCFNNNCFGEVIDNFVFGGDETCIQACNNGATRVIGSAGRKKHERKDQYSRISISVYCTGSISGVDGTTIFLVEYKNKHANYTDKLLQ